MLTKTDRSWNISLFCLKTGKHLLIEELLEKTLIVHLLFFIGLIAACGGPNTNSIVDSDVQTLNLPAESNLEQIPHDMIEEIETGYWSYNEDEVHNNDGDSLREDDQTAESHEDGSEPHEVADDAKDQMSNIHLSTEDQPEELSDEELMLMDRERSRCWEVTGPGIGQRIFSTFYEEGEAEPLEQKVLAEGYYELMVPIDWGIEY